MLTSHPLLWSSELCLNGIVNRGSFPVLFFIIQLGPLSNQISSAKISYLLWRLVKLVRQCCQYFFRFERVPRKRCCA